jgi:hypothetical protein
MMVLFALDVVVFVAKGSLGLAVLRYLLAFLLPIRLVSLYRLFIIEAAPVKVNVQVGSLWCIARGGCARLVVYRSLLTGA